MEKGLKGNQDWFHSPIWQQMEAEATDDLKAGRFADFEDVGALLRDLHEEEST